MHVAVTGVHVQSRPHPAFEHFLVDVQTGFEQGLKRGATENVFQPRADLQLPAGAQSVVLQLREQGIHIGQPALPLIAHLGNQGPRLGHAVFEQLGRRYVTRVIGLGQGQMALGQKRIQSMAQSDFVAQ